MYPMCHWGKTAQKQLSQDLWLHVCVPVFQSFLWVFRESSPVKPSPSSGQCWVTRRCEATLCLPPAHSAAAPSAHKGSSIFTCPTLLMGVLMLNVYWDDWCWLSNYCHVVFFSPGGYRYQDALRAVFVHDNQHRDNYAGRDYIMRWSWCNY